MFHPGHSVVQTISSLWLTRATIHYAQESSEPSYSPMILTSTRFRRRPPRLPGQPFHLASKDPLPGAKIETALCHGDHNLLPHHLPLQVRIGIVLARPPASRRSCSGSTVRPGTTGPLD
jgi:hypothetical protein